jgi:NAD(P)-dependent dehydrogenase (short-subunit alcohol dehydrogenase family)
MTGRLSGRNAIVTGAALGIGRGIARAFAREGAAVLVADVDAGAGHACMQQLRGEFGVRAEFTRTDVGVRTEVLAMVSAAQAHFGDVDILVNNAWAGSGMKRVEHKSDADFERSLRIGVMAALWSMQAVFPRMRERRHGRIINLASLNGVNAHMGTADYNVAKEALRTLTRSAAREWAPHQICCNVICPAARTEAFDRFAAHSPENAQAIAAANPMGRMGDPETDIGPVAVFLASDDARYVTGNTLFVDGGGHINGVAWAPQLPD